MEKMEDKFMGVNTINVLKEVKIINCGGAV